MGERLSKFVHAWKPALIGSILGLLIGFAGGAGAGLVDEIKPSSSGSASASASETPSEIASATPSASTSLSAVAPRLPSSAVPRATLKGPAQTSSTCGRPDARLVRFRVMIEPGLATTPSRFVQGILSVLCDERSWIGSGKVRFRYDPKGALLIGLRTPASSEKRCKQLIGLSVNFYYSCAGSGEVVLNSDRWFHGSKFWPGPVAVYRQMLVNHEVGHTLGQHHRYCPRDGAWAPVMMQQSKGLSTDGKTCKPNPWPLAYEERSLRS